MKDDYHHSPYSDYTRCLDSYHSSYGPSQQHNPDMPRETHGNNCYSTTTTCAETAYGLQCHFSSFLPTPRYETPVLNVNISLDMANLQMINITTLHFHVWQHLVNNHSDIQLQHLVTIPLILVHKVYQHLLNSTLQLTPFNMEPSEDMDTLWSLLTHPGIYILVLGLLIPVGIGLFCCYYFWCQPARLVF